MKIIHLRDQYLRVSFVYFLLKGFRKYEHFVACREIIPVDTILYPYKNILKTSPFFAPFLFLDKLLTVKLGFSARLINDWWSYYFLLRKEKNIGILHAHMGTQGYYAIKLSKKLNIPLIVTFYGSDMSDVPKLPGWRDRYHLLFEHASQIVVEGQFMKSRMVELGCEQEKVSVVKIGVPLDHLQFRERNSWSEGEVLKILMCANFYPKKGYLTALKAIKIMADRGDKLEVVIIGEGPQKVDILNLIERLELGHVVSLIGKRSLDEIYTLSTSFHLFFHPSETAPDGGSEGGAPTIIIEMQALGLPVVSTTHADIPNIIPPENHFLAAEGDPKGLVAQFDKLKSIPDWGSISARGKAFVVKEHSNERCSGVMEEIYSRFIVE